MSLTLRPEDITSQLCQTCGECCRVRLPVENASPSYRKFLREVGVRVLPEPPVGQEDCCPENHRIKADLGDCRHLWRSEGGSECRCSIHGQGNYPSLCAQYNCVSWAQSAGKYDESNELLVRVQERLRILRARRQDPEPVTDALQAPGAL